MKYLPIIALLSIFTGPALCAEKEEGWNPDTKFPPLPPAEAIKTIEVPRGYRLECIASEPMVEEPASFAFDGNGAMYVCEWRTYMQDEFGTDQLAPVSRVVKLQSTKGDGILDKRTVFIDNVVLPRTVLPLHDRVLITFTGANSVWAYFDDNKDGIADRRELAHEGGPNSGNIEHQNSGMVWNLDNTICTNDFRFRYAGGKLIAGRHAVGRISQWGLARDDDGRLFCSWAGGANPAHSFQLPAGYPILKMNEHADGYRVPYASCKVWDQSSGGYKTDEQRVLRDFSACCGQTVLRSHLMPEFYGRVVTCEPVGRLLRMSRIDWKDGFGVADNAFPNSEFIRSTDAYFRPVWSETAPDGTLVFSDMYRGIIQEKAWFPTSDTDNRKDWVARYHRVKKWGMIEVVRHGRIYRLVPDGKPPGPQPRMLDATPAQLVPHLAHPNGWWRDTAQMLVVSRADQSVVPALTAMAGSHADVNARIHAMWTLQGLDALPKQTIIAATKHDSPRVRRAAVQLAEPLLVAKDADIAKSLAAMLGDADAQVRAQLFLAYRAAGQSAPDELTAKPGPLIVALLEKEKADSLQGALTASAKQGRQIYETLCTTCHGPDGKGVKAGDKFLAPAFMDSEWFRNNGNVEILARILLKGQTGPINGVSYGEGFMIPLEGTYNDEQLASVLSFIGERWHNWKKPIAAADIAHVRKEIADRTTPWTHEELAALGKRSRPTRAQTIAGNGGTIVPVAALSGDFRTLDLSAAFTADTRKGLFSSDKATKDSLPFVKFGRVLANGVPYEIADPAKDANGKNVILLSGGPEKSFARTMPQRVEISVGAKVSRLHFLGGVAGWGGGPGANTPAMTATLHFTGGAKQVADLRAGREFVDYIRRIDVPGSQFADGIVSEHQVRTFAIPIEHAAVLEKIILESAGNKVAPTTVAITAEIGTPAASAPASPAAPTSRPPLRR
jgi:mono/diheme cytochrome c family protein